jgi:molybdate transport system ATP-binding protein
MSLEADVQLRLNAFSLDVRLDAGPGELVALLGPNGAGKTTLLRALAGLVPLESGRVSLDSQVLEDPARGIRVPAERRSVGVVFQDYLLFPHLDALDNVAFGLQARGRRTAAARSLAHEWLGRVGLGDRARALPRELSGGQAQRVALARALATDPSLLLLDEPLAALDASVRAEVRRDLRRHLASFAGVRLLITHDPLEAAALADRLVVLEEGRVVQSGSVREVTERPRSRYVADLVGVNLLRGRARDGTVELEGGGRLAVPGAEGEVFVVIRPRSVALFPDRPEGTPRNVWEGRAASLDLEGDRVRVLVDGTPAVVAEVTPAAVAELGLAEGREVWVAVKATEIETYPA